MALEHVQELFDFIQQSPSCFHVIENVKKQLTEQGFEELCENKNWQIKEGGKYFVTRNLSSVIAFKVPTKDFKSFHIVASHSDSPTFKIKDHPEQMVKGKYVQLNTERYGGMIYSTWFDRPLSIAGRALVKTETGVATKLLNIDRDLLVIPNLAVHMDRTVNDGMKYNPQVNLLPLYGDAASKDTFNKAGCRGLRNRRGEHHLHRPVPIQPHRSYCMGCAQRVYVLCKTGRPGMCILLSEGIPEGRKQPEHIGLRHL